MIYMKDRNRQMRGRIQIDDEPRSPNEGGMFQIYDEPESPREGACLRSMMNRKTRKIPPFTKTREHTFKNTPPAERIASNAQCVWNLSKLIYRTYRTGTVQVFAKAGGCNPPPNPPLLHRASWLEGASCYEEHNPSPPFQNPRYKP